MLEKELLKESTLIPIENGRIISNLETSEKYIDDLKFEMSGYDREINMRVGLYATEWAETPFKG